MGKWDVDVDAKQKELDALKLAKAKDLERLQDLTKLVSFASDLLALTLANFAKCE